MVIVLVMVVTLILICNGGDPLFGYEIVSYLTDVWGR